MSVDPLGRLSWTASKTAAEASRRGVSVVISSAEGRRSHVTLSAEDIVALSNDGNTRQLYPHIDWNDFFSHLEQSLLEENQSNITFTFSEPPRWSVCKKRTRSQRKQLYDGQEFDTGLAEKVAQQFIARRNRGVGRGREPGITVTNKKGNAVIITAEMLWQLATSKQARDSLSHIDFSEFFAFLAYLTVVSPFLSHDLTQQAAPALYDGVEKDISASATNFVFPASIESAPTEYDLTLTFSQLPKAQALQMQWLGMTKAQQKEAKYRLNQLGIRHVDQMMADIENNKITVYSGDINTTSLEELKEAYGWEDEDWKCSLIRSVVGEDAISAAKIYQGLRGSEYITSSLVARIVDLLGEDGKGVLSEIENPHIRNLGEQADQAGENDGVVTRDEIVHYATNNPHFIVDQNIGGLLSAVAGITGEPDPSGHKNINDANIVSLRYDSHGTVFNKKRKVAVFSNEYRSGADREYSHTPGRYHRFLRDKKVDKELAAVSNDYLNYDIDRGHLAPAIGGATEENKKSLNILTNIVPQASKLNRITWRLLEAEVEALIQATGAKAQIVTGTVFEPGKKVEKVGRVDKPHQIFKVVVLYIDGWVTALAWLINNTDDAAGKNKQESIEKLQAARVSIADIEQATGLDILGDSLPATVAAAIRKSRAGGVAEYDSPMFAPAASDNTQKTATSWFVGPEVPWANDYYLSTMSDTFLSITRELPQDAPRLQAMNDALAAIVSQGTRGGKNRITYTELYTEIYQPFFESQRPSTIEAQAFLPALLEAKKRVKKMSRKTEVLFSRIVEKLKSSIGPHGLLSLLDGYAANGVLSKKELSAFRKQVAKADMDKGDATKLLLRLHGYQPLVRSSSANSEYTKLSQSLLAAG